jgi:DNA-binding NtrC family response regulator
MFYRNDRLETKSRAGCDSRRRILLVHPDPAGRSYTGKLLENLGHAVTSCSSFKDGIQSLGAEKWDFVVVSQGGRAFEGRAILERTHDIDRHLPVLILTQWHEMACYLDAMQLGAVDYLEEPVSPPELARVVRTHLGTEHPCGPRTQAASPRLRRFRDQPGPAGAGEPDVFPDR